MANWQYGNSRDYFIARLTRDGRTDLLERIQRGELSARAAGREAGFFARRDCVERMQSLYRKLSEADRHAFWLHVEQATIADIERLTRELEQARSAHADVVRLMSALRGQELSQT